MGLIHDAVIELASVCDGAQAKDGQGFNGTDTHFGHVLAATAPHWSPKMEAIAYKMLAKYRGQLAFFGIDYDKIPKPAAVEKPNQEEIKLTVTMTEAVIVLKTSGKHDRFTSEVKMIPGRKWDPEAIAWTIPVHKNQEAKAICKRHFPNADLSILEYSPPNPNRLVVKNNRIAAYTEYDPTFISEVKTGVPGYDWNKLVTKAWSAPISSAAPMIQIFHRHFPNGEIDPELTKRIEEEKAAVEMAKKANIDETMTGIETRLPGGTMYPFQAIGVDYLLKRNGVGLVGDEMGLGKTIQAIGFLKNSDNPYPTVIIVPASLKLNWKREIKKWIGVDSVICSGSKPTKLPQGTKIAIINYDILNKHDPKRDDDVKKGQKIMPGSWAEYFIQWGARTVIVDEAHYIKNPKAARAKGVCGLMHSVSNRILLTGTPLLNRPSELWHLLHCLDPNEWDNFFKYAKRYCDATKGRFGWDFNGISNSKELYERLIGHWMIRRKKSDVLKELPPKVRSVVPIELTPAQRKRYIKAEESCIEELKKLLGKDDINPTTRTMALVKINDLRQATAALKMEHAIEWIENALEAGPLVVFAHHRTVIEQISKHFGAPTIMGGDSQEARQKAVDDFQAGRINLIVCSILAAGVGLTLTAASNVCFLERPWRPGDQDQAEDRIHRIGQTQTAFAWYLDAAETFDEELAEIIETKRSVISRVIDGKSPDESIGEGSIQDEAIKSLLNKKGK